MSVLYTFPGQGSQRVGMLHTLPRHSEVERTLCETFEALGTDPLLLDTAEAFTTSAAVQTCLLAAGVSMARTLAAQGARTHMVAGLSIGAYPAAVIAGALDYADAVRLVARRGQLMDESYPSGYGMAAISGLAQEELEPLIAQIHTLATPVYLANINAPTQFAISGSNDALSATMELASMSGATQVHRLAVSVPSHCELYDQAAAILLADISKVTLRAPRVIYLSSNSARMLADPASIAQDLASNMKNRVNWLDTARLAWERGARLAVEMPSGSILSNLSSPVFASGQVLCCDNNKLETLLTLIEREPYP